MRRALATGAAAALAGLALSGCGDSTAGDATGGAAETGAGSLPLDARSPLEAQGRRIRVLVQFPRQSLAEEMGDAEWSPERQTAYTASLRAEAESTQSSLRAKGVRLGRPVLYARVWNGFAATIAARDLPKLRSLGLRSEPVRRFYGATGSGTRTAAAGDPVRAIAPAGGQSTKVDVALLDTGVDRDAPGLSGRVVRGLDAVDHDADPSPGEPEERHGTQVATVLADALGADGGRILSVRVAGMRRDPTTGATLSYGTTDELLEGLERTVDRDGDGAVDDAVPVALVGVNSPYAGFDDSPEAEAVAGATSLGTLVVAPAGNEGRRVGPLGTVGSPGAAPDALTVAALEGGGAPALPAIGLGLATEGGRLRTRAALLGGEARPRRAGVTGLVGPSQENPEERGRALGAAPLEYFAVDASRRARGRVVVVPARSGGGRSPAFATRATAAAAGGAAALVVCEPDASRALPALPDGAAAIPVVGLRGEAGRRALELTEGGDGGIAFLSAARPAADLAPPRPGWASSQGPTYAVAPKPDLALPGTATVAGRGSRRRQFVAGTSVAAARAAGLAARLRTERPAAEAPELAARLVQTAKPAGDLLAAGAGVPDLERALAATVVAEPAVIAFPRQEAATAFSAQATVTVRNLGSSEASFTPVVKLADTTVTVTPEKLEIPARETATVSLSLTIQGTGIAAGNRIGTLTVGDAKAPVFLPVGPAPPAPLSALRVVERGQSTGVRFTAGAATPEAETLSVQPLGELKLTILDSGGSAVRELTPPGGARDLLPGEYGYTLTRSGMAGLEKGEYRFRAIARGPDGGAPTVRTSPPFSAR